MKTKLLILSVFLSFSGTAGGQTVKPFTVTDTHKETLGKDELSKMEAVSTQGVVSGNALIYLDTDIHIIIRTGPGNDMLSYRIQGLRNPTLVFRLGTMVHVHFINVDDDMNHDFRISNSAKPMAAGSVGTARLAPSDHTTYSTETLIIRADTLGKYAYFCSVSNHAAHGMRGIIDVTEQGSSLDGMEKSLQQNSKRAGTELRPQIQSESGTGIVRAVDFSNQTITLDHGDVPGIMPAMTMAYRTKDPALLKSIQINDHVRFVLSRSASGEFTISSIKKERQ